MGPFPDLIFFAISALLGPTRYRKREGNLEKVRAEFGTVLNADLFGGIHFPKKCEISGENAD